MNGDDARTSADAAADATAKPARAGGVQTVIVSADDDGMRLDRWFRAHYPSLSLSHLNKIVRKGEVRVDGKRVDTSTRLAEGQKLRVPPLQLQEVAAPAVHRRGLSQEDERLMRSITLFEDAHLMVINKPWGLAVQGGPGANRNVDAMLEAMTDAKGNRPRLVHRLDRDTSGVLLIAKTRKMAADLGEVFRARQTRKIYWAVVSGVPKPAQGRVSLFLRKGEGMVGDRAVDQKRGASKRERGELEKMRVAKHGDDDAQHSLTYYAVVDKVAPRLAWLSMRPVTGRTHQLRAHAEAIGHPIIGDPKYRLDLGATDPRKTDPLRALPSGISNKLHLLARRLVLPHPRGGTLDVSAPLPEHMKQTFDLFGFDISQYDPIEDAPDK